MGEIRFIHDTCSDLQQNLDGFGPSHEQALIDNMTQNSLKLAAREVVEHGQTERLTQIDGIGDEMAERIAEWVYEEFV